ncbi:hypothetical protein BSK49_07245 [Paenibacillus odorifer]|jgi:thiol-disulfide isomerase/thioredoxin|uniref:Alkyl hydroperoxide reductase subunit C/ Thiol specific antioxidant domain-containing protein n=1 Tax=Paenibacillus odorifer TaxID=189426 RepID=A0ABX3GFH8_9BACL|nr:hypothetical protein [Paenibacillus odorifer]OMD05152.1 hypothetical protein BSO21_31585 [Paenibacillus odorifer]OMD91123.1 hypothetical protein BSK49_07245 [Paenibacillus odorifer]
MNTQTSMIDSLFKPPRNFSPEVGDYLSNFDIDNSDWKLLDLIRNEHILAVFLSMECKACEVAMEVIDDYINQHSNLNVVIFMNVDANTVKELNSYFQNRARVFSLSKQRMKEELLIFNYPKAFTLNKFGQILKAENCGADFMLDILTQPLRKILLNY